MLGVLAPSVVYTSGKNQEEVVIKYCQLNDEMEADK